MRVWADMELLHAIGEALAPPWNFIVLGLITLSAMHFLRIAEAAKVFPYVPQRTRKALVHNDKNTNK